MSLPSYLNHEDINQEMEVLRLQGITPSRYIVYRRLSSERSAYQPGDMSLVQGTLPWAEHHTTPPEVIEQLVDWALDQAEEVQEIIWDFLDDTDQLLPTIDKLTELGYVKGIKTEKPVSQSMTQILLKSLPATKTELMELIQTVSPETERPAATVRQILRRLSKQGTIIITDELVERKL